MITQNKFFLFEYSVIDIFSGFLMWYIFKSYSSSRQVVLRTPFPPEVQLKKNLAMKVRCSIWFGSHKIVPLQSPSQLFMTGELQTCSYVFPVQSHQTSTIVKYSLI